ncbi:MAG TPA: helix-turn-helix domain-containing protein [Acidimicrobiales bacterium]|nr:helix-turn-helix domain-containing protein [Acidimicrobiales bacterium]
MSAPTEQEQAEPGRPGRAYDGTLRRERAAETRQRIIDAGSELLHRATIRDWNRLTVRAAAERAGVNERTVYRHFGNERGLRDAVMHRLEEDAGIDLEGMHIGDIAKVAAQTLEHVSSYPIEPRPLLDPTLIDANQRQRAALLGAVTAATGEWPPGDQVLAAAMFDVLWSVASYERLAVDWQMDPEQAIRGVTWVIGLVEQAVQDRRGPS